MKARRATILCVPTAILVGQALLVQAQTPPDAGRNQDGSPRETRAWLNASLRF